MRIGLLAPPWIPIPPPAYGGTELVVGLLARELALAGHDVVLVAHPQSSIDGVHLVAAPPVPPDVAIGQVTVELGHVLWSYRKLLEARVDVIHDHTTAGPACGAELARAVGVPVVATNHGPFGWRAREILGRGHCAIVAISHSQARNAGKLPIAAVIHHGIAVDEIPVGRGDGGYAAFLGRFTADKGVTAAIDIARAADVPLRIAAKMWEPEERQYFERRIRPVLGRDVEYVGELKGADKYAFVGAATALLNPIDWQEPFGLNMIEALATGTPVVATPRGSVPEIIEHGRTGFVDEPEALTAALVRAGGLDRRACRTSAEERFSAGRYASEHVALYEQLVSESRPGVAVAV